MSGEKPLRFDFLPALQKIYIPYQRRGRDKNKVAFSGGTYRVVISVVSLFKYVNSSTF